MHPLIIIGALCIIEGLRSTLSAQEYCYEHLQRRVSKLEPEPEEPALPVRIINESEVKE